MRRRRTFGLAAAGAAAALMLAACSSGGGNSSGSGSNSSSSAAYGAGITGVVNPSTHKGGTLTFDWRSAPDSFDPGNTYFAAVWDFARFYSQALMTYKNCPGACGRTLVPGLATAPGQVSDRGLTWTYHLKSGVKFQDGTPVTSQDVKYAVERTFDRGVLSNGPSYFLNLLGGNAKTYPGPFKDRAKNLMGLTAVTTPDSSTIVFHLAHPFSEFDYVVTIPQSAPVPPDKDTGASYQTHIDSTGPYEFQSYQLNKTAVLVPNPNWSAAEDPTVSQLASKIVVNMNMNPNDVDNRLLAGDAQVDFAGTGVQAAARAKILANPNLKSHADDPLTGFGWFFYIDSQVAPFTNLACRQAIEYAANHLTLQNAYGGPVAGGAIGSTALPPTVTGYQNFDLYEATTKTQGDPAKAKQMLQAVRPAERVLHRDRLPQRPADRDPGRPGSPAGTAGRSASRPPCTATRRRATSAPSPACPSTWPRTTSGSPSAAGVPTGRTGTASWMSWSPGTPSSRPATPTSGCSTTRWSTTCSPRPRASPTRPSGTRSGARSTTRS